MIFRATHGRDNPYFCSRRATPQDPRLGWQERGLLFYMLSLPDDWDFNVNHLATVGDLKRDALNRALVRLAELGYVHRYQERLPDGRLGPWRMDVYEEPKLQKPGPENAVAAPKLQKPGPENTTLHNKKKYRIDRGHQIHSKHITEAPAGADSDVLLQPTSVQAQPGGAPSADPAPAELQARLVAAGVGPGVARQLAATEPAECARQLAALPQREHIKNPGAFLAQAIRAHYPPPPAAAPPPERADREQAAQQRRLTLEQQAEQRYAQLAPAERAQRQAQAAQEFERVGMSWLLEDTAVRAVRLHSAVVARLAQEIAA